MITKDSVHITVHSGKMENIRSISTNPQSNTFCQFMNGCGKTGVICTHCYAVTMMKLRAALKEHLQNNSELLSKAVLIPSALPKYSDELMRFNSFGEIINANHLINLFSICNNNPQTTHVLYTKRMNLVEMFVKFKPKNLIIVESNPIINIVRTKPQSKTADLVFNVVTKDYFKDDGRSITCLQHCDSCRKCYTKSFKGKFVVEMLK